MSDQLVHIIANIIVFLALAAAFVVFILFVRFLFSIRSQSSLDESDTADSEKDELLNEVFNEKRDEIVKATAGHGRYANSPYFLE